MKAKVIETGEIVEVYHESQHGQTTIIYKEAVFLNGRMWKEDELDFSVDSKTTEVDLEKELKILDDTLFDLDGVAVKGATSYLTLTDVKDIAKHFFELGLSTQTSTVWHDVSEEIPKKFGESILVASLNNNEEDGIWLYDLIQSWDGEWSPRVNWENPVKWAYMKDLLK